jgi:hypothetical protein
MYYSKKPTVTPEQKLLGEETFLSLPKNKVSNLKILNVLSPCYPSQYNFISSPTDMPPKHIVTNSPFSPFFGLRPKPGI